MKQKQARTHRPQAHDVKTEKGRWASPRARAQEARTRAGHPWRNPAPPLYVADWWGEEGRAHARLSVGLSARSRRLVGVSREAAARALGGPERRRGGGGARPRNARSAGGADRREPVRGRNRVLVVSVEQGSEDTAAMNTVLSRANSLFAFSLSVMAALTFGCFITTAFKDRSVPVRLHVSRIML